MPLPTLLLKGYVDTTGLTASEKRRINDITGLQYIIETLEKMRKNTPKKPSDRYLIIDSGTGTGKSVTLPPEIYLHFSKTDNRNIITSQPRQISAVRTVAKDILDIYKDKFKLGQNIGYQTSNFKKRPIKGLNYVTTGVLLQQLLNKCNELINIYSFIIIDEAHERSLDIDIITTILENFISKNWKDPMCPLVIYMSATLNECVIEKLGKPQRIKIQGASFPVEDIFLPIKSENFYTSICDTVNKIDKEYDFLEEDKNDIIVFVVSETIINKVIDLLLDLNSTLRYKLYPVPLTGAIYRAERKEIQEIDKDIKTLTLNGKPVHRKIFVSTNVAETSLTIDSLRFVIDSGFRITFTYMPNGLRQIKTKPVTWDVAMQRRGRVGRKFPGVWFPLYTEKTFKQLIKNKEPDIRINDPSVVILSLLKMSGNDVDIVSLNNQLVDPIASDIFINSLNKLFKMGAITYENNLIKITPIGNILSTFKINIEFTRMIAAGYIHNCDITHLITIAALMSENGIRGKKYQMRNPFGDDKDKLAFYLNDSFIDNILLLEEYIEVVKSGANEIEWCIENNINYDALNEGIKLRDEILIDLVTILRYPIIRKNINLTKTLKTAPDIALQHIKKIKQCIYDGFLENIAKLNKDGTEYLANSYYTTPPKLMLGMPKYFIFADMVIAGKINFNDFSVLDGFINVY